MQICDSIVGQGTRTHDLGSVRGHRHPASLRSIKCSVAASCMQRRPVSYSFHVVSYGIQSLIFDLKPTNIKERTRDVEAIEPASQKAGQGAVTMAAKSKRRKIKVTRYNSADYLETEADIKSYLKAVFAESVDRQMLIHTLDVVARARGMMRLSKDTGITRAGLYKALSPSGNPSFETVTRIVGAFGMRLSAQAA